MYKTRFSIFYFQGTIYYPDSDECEEYNFDTFGEEDFEDEDYEDDEENFWEEDDNSDEVSSFLK